MFFFSINLFQFIPHGTAVLQLLSNRGQGNNKHKCKIPENYPAVSLLGPYYLVPLKTLPGRRHFGLGIARCHHQRAVSTNSARMLCVLSRFSCVQACATLWTAGHQAPLSMGFSRQEHCSGLPCPPPTNSVARPFAGRRLEQGLAPRGQPCFEFWGSFHSLPPVCPWQAAQTPGQAVKVTVHQCSPLHQQG